jgi:hypothetical protein
VTPEPLLQVSVERNIHFSASAGRGRVDRGNDPRDMPLDGALSALPQNDDGNLAVGKVLLVAQIAVCGDQNFKSRSFGSIEEFTVSQLLPTACACLGDGVLID